MRERPEKGKKIFARKRFIDFFNNFFLYLNYFATSATDLKVASKWSFDMALQKQL